MSKNKHFTAEWIDDVCVMVLADANLYDVVLVKQVESEVLSFLTTERPEKVALCFSRVTHAGSQLIGTMLRLKNRLQADGAKLKLCGMRDSIRQGYKAADLDGKLFAIYEESSNALDAFRKEAKVSPLTWLTRKLKRLTAGKKS